MPGLHLSTGAGREPHGPVQSARAPDPGLCQGRGGDSGVGSASRISFCPTEERRHVHKRPHPKADHLSTRPDKVGGAGGLTSAQ